MDLWTVAILLLMHSMHNNIAAMKAMTLWLGQTIHSKLSCLEIHLKSMYKTLFWETLQDDLLHTWRLLKEARHCVPAFYIYI